MDLKQTTNDYFSNSIQHHISIADQMVDPAVSMAELIANTLLNNNKVICYGEGKFYALAQLFHSHLAHQFNHDRPSLPALLLGSETLLQHCTDKNYNLSLERTLQHICCKGDILLVLSGNTIHQTTQRLIDQTHQMEAASIVISGDSKTTLKHAIHIALNSETSSHLLEAELLLVNILCHLVDTQLFGY